MKRNIILVILLSFLLFIMACAAPTPYQQIERLRREARRDGLRNLKAGVAAAERGEHAKAIEHFTHAITYGILSSEDLGVAHYNRGNSYNAVDQYGKAINDLENAIGLNPENVMAYNNLSRILSRCPNVKFRNGERALKFAKRAQRLVGEKPYIIDTLIFALAEAREEAFVRGDYTKAINFATEAIEWKKLSDENRAIAYHHRGNSWSALGQHTNAIRDFGKAIELKPGYAFAYHDRGNSFNTLEEYGRAVKDFGKAIELKPGYVSAHHDLARLLLLCPDEKHRDLDRALEHAKKALQLEGEAPPILETWVLAHAKARMAAYRQGEHTKAEALATEAIDSGRLSTRDLAVAYQHCGLFRRDMDQHENAVEDFTRAIELIAKSIGPGKFSTRDLAVAHRFRGNSLNVLGRYDEAIKDFGKAIKLNQNYASAHHDLARLLLLCPDEKHRNLDRAIMYAKRAVEIQEIPYFLNTLAKAYNEACAEALKKGEHSRVIALATEAIGYGNKFSNEDRTIAYYYRGSSLNDLGRYGEAVKDFGKATKLNPNFASAHNDLAWILATCPKEEYWDSKRAVKLAKKAVKLAGETYATLDTLGAAYARANDTGAVGTQERAIELLEKTIKLYKKRPGGRLDKLTEYNKKLEEYNKRLKRYNSGKPWVDKR